MMESIGNDIVVLKATDPARSVTPRFYKKFLSSTEIGLAPQEQDKLTQHQFIWMAWSIKEAAFKCLKRLDPALTFSPIKIQLNNFEAPNNGLGLLVDSISRIGFNDGTDYVSLLKFYDIILHSRSMLVNDAVIHSVVSLEEDFSNVSWSLSKIDCSDPRRQSELVRQILLDFLRGRGFESPLISTDTTGIPSVTLNEVSLPVSLSHHDRWVGYAIPVS